MINLVIELKIVIAHSYIADFIATSITTKLQLESMNHYSKAMCDILFKIFAAFITTTRSSSATAATTTSWITQYQ